MQKAALVQPHRDGFPAQVADQRFDQVERGFIVGSRVQVTAHLQANIVPAAGFGAEQQAEGVQFIQTFLKQVKTADVEVGGGHIQGVDVVVAQQAVEHIRQDVFAVVDDVGKVHGNLTIIFIATNPGDQPVNDNRPRSSSPKVHSLEAKR